MEHGIKVLEDLGSYPSEASQMVEYQIIAIGKLGSNTCGSGCMTSQEEEHQIIVISDPGLNPVTVAVS